MISSTTTRAVSPAPRPPRALPAPAALPLLPAVLLAVVAGFVLTGSFPGLGWWPLAFVGTALMLWSLIGRTFLSGVLVGLFGGFSFFGSLVLWSTVYLGPVPWLALSSATTVFFAAGTGLIAVVWRWAPVLWPTRLGRLGLVPLIVAGVWLTREAVISVWPWGGFSWGRLSFSQSESPFGHLAAYLGASGLSFLIAWLCALLLQLARERTAPWSLRGGLAVAAVAGVLAVPAWPTPASGSIRVAAVQGDSDSGLFAQHRPGEILQDHISGTLPLIGQPIDLVVWPENASDLDPLRYPQAADALDYLSANIGAPIVTGTITQDGDKTYNSVLLWEAGKGAVAQYDKMHPVPFAEYLPDRDFFYPLAPDLFKLVPRDYSIGTRPNVFDIDGVKAGIAICFDIVDDSLIQRMADGGAQLILAPTNNADFGHTDESAQQLAIARLRAIETGRSLVNISTVGTSAIIAPDGSTIDRLPVFEPGSMVAEVPLSTAVTPAMAAVRGPEWLGCGIGLAGLLMSLGAARGSRRRRED